MRKTLPERQVLRDIVAADLPELVTASCDACQGEGYTLRTDPAAAGYAEIEACCAVCGGSGKLEVCSGCSEVPKIVGGLELCSCVATAYRRAA